MKEKYFCESQAEFLNIRQSKEEIVKNFKHGIILIANIFLNAVKISSQEDSNKIIEKLNLIKPITINKFVEGINGGITSLLW